MKDVQIEKILTAEKNRQKKVINLIASENYVSGDVLKVLGSELTNKYAEGYPHARYYGGQENVDQLEDVCIERALKLFSLTPNNWHANVQPLSGSAANLAVYTALVPQHEKIMGMSLADGGHLTHGHKVSASGKFWTSVQYGVAEGTEIIDYDVVEEMAMRERPKLIIAGFTSYSRIIDFKRFREIADRCHALLMIDMSHIAGLIAGGVYPSPFPYADVVTTTTHKTLRGPRSAIIFSRITDKELHKKIDRAVFPGLQGGPHMNQIGAVAVALKEASTSAFKTYAKKIVGNAEALSFELQKLGWRIVSGGTDIHFMLVDTWIEGKGISGGDASIALEKEGIIVNKNSIPFDIRSPFDPSGIRLGTAAETTRGKGVKDMKQIARKIDEILRQEIETKKVVK